MHPISSSIAADVGAYALMTVILAKLVGNLVATPTWRGLRAGGTASARDGCWPDCGVWVTCQRSFRASRLLLWRLTETYSSQFHNVLLTSYGIYSRISQPLRDPSVLGRITSCWQRCCPLRTIGTFFLGCCIMPSALLWVTPRGR